MNILNGVMRAYRLLTEDIETYHILNEDNRT